MKMNRRGFLGAMLTGACAVSGVGRVLAQTTRSDRLILSAPLTHSDWMLKSGVAWGPAGVKHMLDACKACGWSRIFWRALDGGRALYKSKLLRPMGKWDEDSFWSPRNEADGAMAKRLTAGLTNQRRAEILEKFNHLDYASFDPLAEAVRYGHQIGLQIHAWVSINEDDHGWGLRSAFSAEHPEYRWRRRDGRFYHSQMSFAFEAVRQYKLAILRELLDGYAIDGLFIDWIRTGDVRDNPQTDRDGVADSGYEEPLLEQFKLRYGIDAHDVPNGDDRWVRVRAQPQTIFMRAVRELVRTRKVPIAVLVGHPWHYRGEGDKIDGNLRGLLLEVRTWAREGLADAAVAAGYYRDGGTAEMGYRALKEESEGKMDVWTYAWVPQNEADFDRDFALAQNVGARQMLFWEADYIDDRTNAPALKALMSSRARW
jgi:hypothetical protein